MLKGAFGNRIQVKDGAKDWKEAIRMVMKPLEEEGYIEGRYTESIFENVEKNGDYFIIMPGFALPHSRSEEGAIHTGLSFLKLQETVTFSSGQEVGLLIGLAAKDSSSHLDLLGELTDILIDEDKMEQIARAQNAEQIQEILA